MLPDRSWVEIVIQMKLQSTLKWCELWDKNFAYCLISFYIFQMKNRQYMEVYFEVWPQNIFALYRGSQFSRPHFTIQWFDVPISQNVKQYFLQTQFGSNSIFHLPYRKKNKTITAKTLIKVYIGKNLNQRLTYLSIQFSLQGSPLRIYLSSENRVI